MFLYQLKENKQQGIKKNGENLNTDIEKLSEECGEFLIELSRDKMDKRRVAEEGLDLLQVVIDIFFQLDINLEDAVQDHYKKLNQRGWKGEKKLELLELVNHGRNERVIHGNDRNDTTTSDKICNANRKGQNSRRNKQEV